MFVRTSGLFRKQWYVTWHVTCACMYTLEGYHLLARHTPRSVLLALLIAARGGTFLIEQPGGSYMEFYDKMAWLYDKVPVFWLSDFFPNPLDMKPFALSTWIVCCDLILILCSHTFFLVSFLMLGFFCRFLKIASQKIRNDNQTEHVILRYPARLRPPRSTKCHGGWGTMGIHALSVTKPSATTSGLDVSIWASWMSRNFGKLIRMLKDPLPSMLMALDVFVSKDCHP